MSVHIRQETDVMYCITSPAEMKQNHKSISLFNIWLREWIPDVPPHMMQDITKMSTNRIPAIRITT